MLKATKSFRFIVVSIAIALITSTFAVIGQDVAEQINSKSSLVSKQSAEWVATGEVESLAPEVAQTGSYVFGTTTTGSLTDMSSGTTTAVAANVDDSPASTLANIGFDFYFQGVRYSQFSVNANGVLRLGAGAQTGSPYKPLGQAGLPIITAYGADQRTVATTGKVHYKIVGSAPNRVLVIEWLNMQANWNSGGTADLTYQVILHETTGIIEFVYGSMTMSTLGAADVNSQNPNIGFSSSNLAQTIGAVTAPQSGTPDPTYDGTLAAPAATNLYTAGAITTLTSATNGTRRTFSFTPPVPTGPTAAGMMFTSIAASSYTINWVDAADEDAYAIYRSTDGGTTYSYFGAAAEDAVSFNATGLALGTTYHWKVFSVSEGALSTTSADGSQSTAPAGNISCSGTPTLWSAPTSWSGGVVPTNTDNVTIQSGCTVTIDVTTAVAYTVTVQNGGILEYIATPASTLTVAQSVTVDSGGTFQTAATGTTTTHSLVVGTNLTNDGTLDFSTNTNLAGAAITFTGAANNTFGGAGATTDIRAITINKGTSNANVLELNPTNFTVQGVATDVAGFLTLTNGTFKLSGTFAGTNRVFTAAAFSIGATTGFWMNNPNYIVAGQAGSSTVSGLFRMTQGTFNIGTGTGNSMGFANNSVINVEGGAINATGRFGVSTASNSIFYTQSGGTITVCTIGNASTTLASFDLGTGVGTSAISGGTIIVQLPNSSATVRDYRDESGNVASNHTGGTLQLGNASSVSARAFQINGIMPNVVIDGTFAHSVTMRAPSFFNNASLNMTINTGTTLNIGNQIFLLRGSTINNGTLTGNGASSRYYHLGNGVAQTYSGSGVTTAPLTSFDFDNPLGVTLSSTNQVITNRVILFSGDVTGAGKITLGNAGATTGAVQIGNTTTPTAAGLFDAPFTFNLGSGGQVISYLRTTPLRTTGPEVNPTRNLFSMTFDNDAVGATLTVAGGDITLTNTAVALTLANGRVVTGANNLILASGTATVTRPNGYVDGNFRKAFAAAANKTFEVGTANGYSPVAVNVTAATFPANFNVKAVQGAQPNIPNPALALSRYWSLSGDAGVTADLTFNYLDPLDIPVTATEANFVIQKYNAGFTQPGGTVTPATNIATITGVTAFSDWTLADPAALVVAEADLSITKTDTPDPTTVGGTITYTITATNAGPIAAALAVVDDVLPAGTTFASITSPGGWSCTTPAVNTNGTVNCTNPSFGVGSAVFTVVVNVLPAAGGTVVSNTATVSSATTDPDSSNNSATATTNVTASADVSITKDDSATTATAGTTVSYTIGYANAGPQTATAVTLTETVPVGTTFNAGGSTVGWVCVPDGNAGSTCTFAVGSLTSGASGSAVFAVNLAASATGMLANTATISAAEDTTPGNNSATDTDTIVQSADLSITKNDGATQYLPGGTVTYTITVSNAGPSSVPSAAVVDNFPVQVASVAWTCVTGGGGGVCAPNGTGNITQTANLPAGGSVVYTAIATISPSATGSMTNTATVDGSPVTDPDPMNNSASDTDTLAPASIQFSSATYMEDESQTASITITRTIDTSGISTVEFSAAPGAVPTAVGGAACAPGIDFVLVSGQVVTFIAGDTEETVNVTICGGDTIQEIPAENIALSLANATNGAVGTPGTAVLKVNDTASQFLQSPVHTPIDMFFGQSANPYPSQITVAGAPMLVGTMRVTLYDVSHALPDNMDVLLVGPLGQKYLLVADTGGNTPISPNEPVTLTFSDTNTLGHVPDAAPWTTGQFLPTVCDTNTTAFAGVAGPYVTPNCSTPNPAANTLFGTPGTGFGLTNPNGVWSLYVRDDAGQMRPIGDTANFAVGTIAGGWGLEFLAPTAADASISGRVLTAEGRGIRGAIVTITGNSLTTPINVQTGVNGRYTIPGLTAGETYVVTVASRRFFFGAPSRVITLNDNVTDADFTAGNGGR